MTDLLQKILDLIKDFNISIDANQGVRDWSISIGINPKDNPEEFIKRVIITCSQQFNFREENKEGLNAESVMTWIREGYKQEDLDKLNLVYKRIRLGTLSNGIEYWFFWKFLAAIYGKDPVNKRVSLARMILKDSGFKIANNHKLNIAIDYNILAVLKYIGLINYKGDFQDTKEEVNRIRKQSYKIIENLIKQNNLKDTYIDGLMFFLGRELRKRNLINVCLYKGCTDY